MGISTFADAVNELQQLLSSTTAPFTDLRWLGRADVVLQGKTLNARSDLTFEEREQRARRAFADATGAFGVEVFAIGRDAHTVYCGLFVPASAAQAADRLVSGVKVKTMEPLLPVELISPKEWEARSRAQSSARRAFLDELIS